MSRVFTLQAVSILLSGYAAGGVWETLPSYAHAEEPTLEDAYLYLISKEELR